MSVGAAIGYLFTLLIAQPIFNLLVVIYALLPGHNFGLSVIIFTFVIRLLLWPLVRKQLHQTKQMRKLQPELRRIKKEAKGDRAREQAMTMALYKEHGFNPLGSLGIAALQTPVLFALYAGLSRVVSNPQQLVSFSYPALRQLPWLTQLAHNTKLFDGTLFGVVDLTKGAFGVAGTYWPALVIVVASAVIQYFQGKQLLVTDKNARSLRDILRAAGEGQEADQAEVSAAVGGLTVYFLPIMVFIIASRLPSGLGLYWLVGGLVAYGQQALILREDETELEELADQPATKRVASIPEAELVTPATDTNSRTKKRRQRKRRKKR